MLTLPRLAMSMQVATNVASTRPGSKPPRNSRRLRIGRLHPIREEMSLISFVKEILIKVGVGDLLQERFGRLQRRKVIVVEQRRGVLVGQVLANLLLGIVVQFLEVFEQRGLRCLDNEEFVLELVVLHDADDPIRRVRPIGRLVG